ncbi:hypothetical protein CQW23_23281 [Capsicum baccatum]|uniref:Uncharacterized protein n=1 Tax=Capsicum baccatum TaxID=33114 RepID=A0A2G2VRH7_CAPBA|nr:hypothetical protein CQW23_23281 [Capsicum baccatum]
MRRRRKDFRNILNEVVRDVLSSEKLFVGGNFNGLIGSLSRCYDNVHVGFGFGERSEDDVNCKLEINDNGSYIVRVSATSTIVVAELRRPLELLMRGKIMQHVEITPTVVQLLFSQDGIEMMRTVHRETGAYSHLDKHSLHVRVFGLQTMFIGLSRDLLTPFWHYIKVNNLRCNFVEVFFLLMKKIITIFGPELSVLKEKSLLSIEKLEEIFRASLGAFVSANNARSYNFWLWKDDSIDERSKFVSPKLLGRIGELEERVESSSNCAFYEHKIVDEKTTRKTKSVERKIDINKIELQMDSFKDDLKMIKANKKKWKIKLAMSKKKENNFGLISFVYVFWVSVFYFNSCS